MTDLASIAFGPGRPGDGAGIVRLVRSGYTERELELTLYGCRGIEAFVEAVIRRRHRSGDTVFTVATDAGGDLTGCAELRLSLGSTHLNYISVDQTLQRQGLGRRLFLEALESVDALADRVTLDVLERNTGARAWYARLGFQVESQTEWWSIAWPDLPPEARAYVSGAVQADLCHQVLGFSQLVVSTELATYTVGRLGSRWYRLTSGVAVGDSALLATLLSLDEGRGLLAVLPGGELGPDSRMRAQLVQRSFRMAATTRALLSRLRDRRGVG